MNFISMESPTNQVELKYCERCGGLFLRVLEADVVFCATCAIQVAELPEPTMLMPKKSARKSRAPRLVQGPKPGDMDDFESGVPIGSLQAVAMEVGSC